MKSAARLFLLLVTFASLTYGTTFVVPTDQEMVDRADVIVVGVVDGSFVRFQNGRIETVVEIRLQRTIKGLVSESILLRVVTPGGEYGNLGQYVPGAPRFRNQERVLLFLSETPRGFEVTDLALGKFRFATALHGEALLVRDTEDVEAWERNGAKHREKLRLAEGFLRFVENRAAGRPVATDYFAAPYVALDEGALAPMSDSVTPMISPYTPQSYTQMGSSSLGVRWPLATAAGGVTFYKLNSQDLPGAGDGGVSFVQNGLDAWENECGSTISLPYGGQTATSGGSGALGINVIEYNDPRSVVSGTWTGSGTVGITVVTFYTQDGDDGIIDNFRPLADADITFQDGLTASVSGLATAMTHEIGHAIGFRHSNADPSDPNAQTVNCDGVGEECTATNTAVMFWQSTGGGFGYSLQPWDVNAVQAVYPGGACTLKRGDANSDGRSDVFWRNPTSGENAIWIMNGAGIQSSAYLPTVSGGSNMQMRGFGYFNADLKADIVWRNSSTGENALWLMDGASLSSGILLPTVAGSDWQIAGVADFDADGDSDILWRNTSSGVNALWIMNGTSLGSGAYLSSVSTSMSVAGVGDLNGDGRADIVWRDNTTGTNAVWLMTGGSTFTGAYLPSLSAPWIVATVADLNGNARNDIVWRNPSSGETAVWFMDGASLTSGSFLPTVSTSLSIVASGDFDGDGNDDLFWRNGSTGENAVWLMDGTALTGVYLPSVSATFGVTGPR